MNPKNFKELLKELPKLLKELKSSATSPYNVSDICGKGVGVKTILKKIGKKEDDDFPGCYLFLEKNNYIYVGISKHVITRLQSHVKGKTHYSCSFAYNIAKKKVGLPEDEKISRDEFVKKYSKEFNEAVKRISEMKVAWVEINDPTLLYIFEVYASIELNTLDYNSFETH